MLAFSSPTPFFSFVLFLGFFFHSFNRSEKCKPQSPPAPNIAHEHECGRPLGLRFMKSTGQLYIADSYFGLLVVEPHGGEPKHLVSEAEGSRFAFTNDLDISPDGLVYFSVTSDLYPRRYALIPSFTLMPTCKVINDR